MKTFFDCLLEFAKESVTNPNFQNSEKFKDLQERIKAGITVAEYEAAMLELNKMQSSFLGKMNEVKKATD